MLCPDGRRVTVERRRDAAEDAQIAADQTARAERLRRMTLRDAEDAQIAADQTARAERLRRMTLRDERGTAPRHRSI